MKRIMTGVSLTLIGMVWFLSGNAWAGRDHHPGHAYEKRHGYGGSPYSDRRGWHRDWHHRRGDHFDRNPYKRKPHFKRFHHDRRHHLRHPFPPRWYFEKHGHRHPYKRYHDHRRGRYYTSGSLWEPGFVFSFGISGSR